MSISRAKGLRTTKLMENLQQYITTICKCPLLSFIHLTTLSTANHLLGRGIRATGKRLGKRLPWQGRGQKNNNKMGLMCTDREDDTRLELTQARFHLRSSEIVELILPAFCQP